MLKKEINLLRLAFQFYSRIPMGKTEYSEENLTKAFRYFPLVGAVVGAAGGLIVYLASFLFPISVGVIFGMIVMVITTGGLHEDGLADFFDGFGGGQTKERILAIMKDSMIGTYGVISLVLLFLLKFTLYTSIDTFEIVSVIVAAHTSSRFMSIVMINTSTYARKENSKSMHTSHKNDWQTILIAFMIAVLPFFFLPWQIDMVAITAYILIYLGIKKFIERKIGGFTGDVLGALQQFCEVVFYIAYVGLILYI